MAINPYRELNPYHDPRNAYAEWHAPSIPIWKRFFLWLFTRCYVSFDGAYAVFWRQWRGTIYIVKEELLGPQFGPPGSVTKWKRARANGWKRND